LLDLAANSAEAVGRIWFISRMRSPRLSSAHCRGFARHIVGTVAWLRDIFTEHARHQMQQRPARAAGLCASIPWHPGNERQGAFKV